MTVARFVLRLCVGGFFVGHGTQKLFGWFGGPGLEATGEGFERLGLRPGRVNVQGSAIRFASPSPKERTGVWHRGHDRPARR